MTDPTSPPGHDNAAVADGPESPPRMPGWVKWPAVVIGVLVLVLVGLRLLGVQHGPGLHTPGGGNPPASTTPGTHAPGGGHR